MQIKEKNEKAAMSQKSSIDLDTGNIKNLT